MEIRFVHREHGLGINVLMYYKEKITSVQQ